MNPLHKLCLQMLTFLNTESVQAVEILPHGNWGLIVQYIKTMAVDDLPSIAKVLIIILTEYSSSSTRKIQTCCNGGHWIQ